jgi:hypothetical protein
VDGVVKEASIFCQGTLSNNDKATNSEGRVKGMRMRNNDLERIPDDSGNPKRLKLRLQLLYMSFYTTELF